MVPAVNDIIHDKRALRSEMTRRRALAVDAAAQDRATAHLGALLAPLSGQALAGYLPIRSEIDPLPAMRAHHGPQAMPVVTGPDRALEFRRWHPDAALEKGAFGTMVPVDPGLVQPRVLIVPLLAFDARGYRLGYGGGFYDRTLQALRARGPVLAIGLAWGAQRIDEVPTEPTDEPLDIIVTDTGPMFP